MPKMEVDLHIHQLVDSTRGLTNHEMLNIQLETAKRQLEFAIRKGIQKVVFIHGVGEGILKEELNYLFGRYENIKYYDAEYQKYGLGATEVYIYQNL
jgi:dsDNA-specific endonuclease/ATPase MutS2